MAGRLWIIRGLPGSGKTTTAQQIMAKELYGSAQHFEADMYFTSPSGEYIYDPALASEAHSWCRFAVGACMERGFDVIVANTFVRRKDMEPYEALARRHGYEVCLLTCRGTWPSTHNVPEEVMERMRRAWEE